jgi:hypothetical protein
VVLGCPEWKLEVVKEPSQSFAGSDCFRACEHFAEARAAEIASQMTIVSEGFHKGIFLNQGGWRYGGNPTSHTPAHNVPAVAAAFRL